jgi:Ca2+-binding RTX toxin-like protein
MTRSLRKTLVLAVLTLGVTGGGMAAHAPPAAASTVQLDGPTLTYDAAPGESNRLIVALSSGTLTVTDTGAVVSAGPGCSTISSTKASCPAAGVAAMALSTGDMNDTASVSSTSIPTTFSDGPGNDTMTGGGAVDTFISGTGSDVFHGGGGQDIVDYSSRTAPLTVSLDGYANDGEAGEKDNVGTDVDVVIGGSANDTITGSGWSNDLYGGPGDDTLKGGSGNDRLFGESGRDSLGGDGGNDTLDGGSSGDVLAGGSGTDVADYSSRSAHLALSLDGQANDGETGEGDNLGADIETLTGGAGPDTITGNATNNTLNGGPGNDTLSGAGGNDILSGSVGDDTLDGGDANDSLDGGAGQDTLRGAAGNDNLQGGIGDDTLDGGDGSDTLAGGDGTDLADYSTRTAALTISLNNGGDDGASGERDNVRTDVENVSAGSGADKLTGDSAANVLSGGAGNDTLDGGAGDDTLRGGAGDDRLLQNAGNDTLDGGDGSDLADYSGERAPVTITLDGQPNDGENGERDNVGPTIERVTGGSGGDRLIGDDGSNTLIGGGGADTLVGAGGNDSLQGGDGDDLLDGSSGADDIAGGSGNDTADYSLRGAPVSVTLDDQPGDGQAGEGDNVHSDVDSIVGGSGNDHLVGNSRNNNIQGGPGDDRIDGGLGADNMAGGPGIDTVDYSARTKPVTVSLDDQANDGESNEHDNVQNAIDIVRGGRGNDTLYGNDGSNTIYGGPGNDTITGYGGDDVLAGEAGRDHVNGGSGRDRIDGGADADTIDARDRYPDMVRCGSGHDTVSSDAKKDRLKDCEGRHSSSGSDHAPAKKPATTPAPSGRRGALARLASTPNPRGHYPSVRGHVRRVKPCTSATVLQPTWVAAARAFGLKWSVLAAITQIESGFGCNMGPSKAGAIGWTQFMPATWRRWGMDADGDHRASPYDSVDAIFSTARYLRASGAPHSYRRAIFAYNHAGWYVRDVLHRAKLFGG